MSEIYSPGSIPGPPVTFLGAYDAGTTYSTGQAVSSGGSSYISLANANVGNPPASSPTQWGLLAAAGANGAPGSAGAPGTNGQVTNSALAAAVGLMSRTSDGGINQLDPTKTVPYLINGDGSISSSGGWTTSGFVWVTGPLMLANFNMVGNDRPVCCFDINQSFLGHATLTGGASLPDPTTAGTVIQLLDGTAYVRFTGYPGHPNATSDMVVFGDAANPPVMPGSYISFSRYPASVVDGKIAAVSSTVGSTAGEIVTAALPAGRNLYDATARSDGYYLQGGTLQGGTYTPLSTSGFILVAGLSTIYCNGVTSNQGDSAANGGSVAFYDINRNFLGNAVGETQHPGDKAGFVPNAPIAVPAGAIYARITTQASGGSGYFASQYIAPAALMVMSTPTPSAYVAFGLDSHAAVDSKIAAAVAAATASIETQIAALGGGLGAVHESRPVQVAMVEGGSVAAGGSATLFSATGGPGSVERIQLAFTNAGPTSAKLTEMEACTLTIAVDGNVFTSTVGMFFLNVGISDANPAGEVFSTRWLERSLSLQEQQQGLGRRIYIPYQNSCSIVFTAATAPMNIYTQVDYYKGAPLPGLHSPNRKVFHMATLEWKDSAGLTPYQQIQLLTSPASGPGILEHWHIAASCNASGIGDSPAWLEANPSIAFDGTSFGAGGTEDFFGTQYYGSGLQPKADEFSFSLFSSAKTGLTYTLLARHFDKFPLPFTTALGPVTWSNGQGGEGATPLPNLKCGMQIVWYTAS